MLAAPLALLLQRALLERRTKAALAFAVPILLIKEEFPLLVGLIALSAWIEEIVRGERKRHDTAIAVMALATVSLPILLAIVKSQPHTAYSPGSFSRLEETKAEDMSSLLRHVATHPHVWLGSVHFRWWVAFAFIGSLGLYALRPHLLVLALPLSLVTWLMHTHPLWAPRFAPGYAFTLTVTVSAIASAEKALSARGRMVVGVVAALAIALQLNYAPQAREIYTLSPWSYYTPELRQEADKVFARYAAEAKPGEPAAASFGLFHYVHADDLWWFNRSRERPPLQWILWDDYLDVAPTVSVSRSDYVPLERSGRFTLYKRVDSPPK
jgi:hypothetical protein